MPKSATEIASVSLAHTKDGVISIAHIEQPYGEYSSPVVSVVISLDGQGEDWKIHVPYENLDELIKGLEAARDHNETVLRKELHTAELNGDIGGGA